MENRLVYEHPLNERIRTMLRIENSFNRLAIYSESPEIWDTQLAISMLNELNDLVKLSDIKSDLVKDLERSETVLRALEDKPGVDNYKLKRVLDDLSESLEYIRSSACQPGATLDADELITSIKQKGSALGGACSFDLPAYHYWLNRPARVRQQRLKEWQKDLLIIPKSVELALGLIRSNAMASKETAENGYFQHSIETGASYQLLRVVLSRSLKCFPEISGGKHRITIRFMEQKETTSRPTQIEKDVGFDLHFCIA